MRDFILFIDNEEQKCDNYYEKLEILDNLQKSKAIKRFFGKFFGNTYYVMVERA